MRRLRLAAFQLSCFSYRWKSIIDHLLTHEKTMFKDLMSEYSFGELSVKLQLL